MVDFSGPSLELDRGDTDYLDGAFTKSDGSAQDITGWTISFMLKRSLADPDSVAVVHKTTGNGGVTITNAVGGLYTVGMLPADFAGLPNRRQSFFGDVTGKDGSGGVNRGWKGKVIVRGIVTETP